MSFIGYKHMYNAKKHLTIKRDHATYNASHPKPETLEWRGEMRDKGIFVHMLLGKSIQEIWKSKGVITKPYLN